MLRPGSLGRSLVLSAFFHLGVILGCALFFHKNVDLPLSQSRLKVDLISLSRKETSKQRIVQTREGKRVPVADKDAYLGEKSQRVDRETVSRSRAIQMGHAGKSASRPPSNVPRLKDLGIGLPSSDAMARARQDVPQWASPGQTPQDRVPGIRESDSTALNTREYVFYSYYQRIRGQLEQAWFPLIKNKVEQFYRSGRHLASDYEHLTRVMVYLNKEGSITRVKILESSGTYDLDEAAVDAFNQAGPFPNPPKGMFNPSGEIEIPWDFVLRS